VLVEAGYGYYVIKTAPSDIADSTITFTEWFRVDNLGNVIFSQAALALTATDGYTFIPTCAGVPTGVPAQDSANHKALIFDKTNNDLYFYNSGWKLFEGPGSSAHLSLQAADLGKGSTAPAQVVLGNYTGWEYDINDDSVISLELPHDLDPTQDVMIDFGWYINEAYATANAEVNFQLDWSLTPHDNTEAVDAPTHSGTVTTGDINIPATAKYLQHTSSFTIAAANITANDHLGITFSRIALVGGVNPTAKPTVVGIEIEYTKL